MSLAPVSLLNRRALLHRLAATPLLLSACTLQDKTLYQQYLGKPWQPYPQASGPATMQPDTAYALYLGWKKHLGPVYADSRTGLDLESNGSFKARHGAADFDYRFGTKTLMVMKQVLPPQSDSQLSDSDVGAIAERRLAQLEPYTLGEGTFYINPSPWLTPLQRETAPNGNSTNLKRDFTDNNIPADRFLLDVYWLIFWAEYWYPYNSTRLVPGATMAGGRRAFLTSEEQATTRPAVERWARETMSKGVPPLNLLPSMDQRQ